MIQKHFACLLALALTMFVSATVCAQDPNHVLGVTDADVAPGADFDLTTTYDNTSPDNVSGWSYGLGHDPAAMTLLGVVDGATTATVDGGSPPGFSQINEFPDGFTVGVVISFLGLNPLAPGTGFELNVASYTNALAAGESVDVCYTGTLGTPPVSTVVVVNGQSVVPTQNCGVVTSLAGPPPFLYTANDVPSAPLTGSFAATFSILDQEGALDDTQGFSMGVGNDPAMINPTSVEATGVLATLAPAFFGEATFADGWTVGVVYSFLGGVFLQFGTAEDVVLTSYDIVGTPAGGDTTPLSWTDSLGSPPVANVVVVGGQSVGVEFADGTVTFSSGPPSVGPFLRGDCNTDGIVNIADGVWLINELFLGGPASSCPVACDANGDGMADSSDAVYIWNYRFLGGAAPVAPFPTCDVSDDAGDVALGCSDGGCL